MGRDSGPTIPAALIARFFGWALLFGPLSAIAGFAASVAARLHGNATAGDSVFVHDVVAGILLLTAGLVAAAVRVLDGEDAIVSEGVRIELPRAVRRGISVGSLGGALAGVLHAGRWADVDRLLVVVPVAWAIGGVAGWIIGAFGSPIDSEGLPDAELDRLARSRVRRRASAKTQITLALLAGGMFATLVAFTRLIGTSKEDRSAPIEIGLVVVSVALITFGGRAIRRAAAAKRKLEAEHEAFKADLE